MNIAYTAAGGFAGHSHSIGVSQEAQDTQERIARLLGGLYNTQHLGEPFKSTLEQLEEVFEECADKGWDGYGAPPGNIGSYLEAKRFLRALPAGVPVPEITIEPDGDVGIEWYLGKGRVFVVSLSSDGMLTYAGKFGRSKLHGTEYFYDEVPSLVLTSLRNLLKK